MAGDRRRASHSIDVPISAPTQQQQQNSRKRRTSCSQDERDSYLYEGPIRGDEMDECNAALVLMSLSCSPHSPHPAWNRNLGSSPGSSNASWSSSGSSSPPLSDDGGLPPIMSESNTARIRTASTSDEGIVMDYNEEAPRKRRAQGPRFRCTWKKCAIVEYTVAKIEAHVRNAHLGPKKPRHSFDDDGGTFSDSDHEEEFYYTEIEDEENGPTPPSPPTLSHRDMARPPHEDPEFQKQLVGSYRNSRQSLMALQQQNSNSGGSSGNTKLSPNPNAGPINIPTSTMTHQKYTWPQQSPVSPHKHPRCSPRPSTSSAPYPSPPYMHHHHHHHYAASSSNTHHTTIHHANPHHSQNIPSITSNSVHHSPNSIAGGSPIANLSHSAPTGSPISISGHNPAMHLSHQHQPHHHSSAQHQQQQQQHQPQHQHHHQSVIPHHAQHHQQHGSIGGSGGGGSSHHQQQSPSTSTGSSGTQHHQQSPKGRTRGENKKCRKVYGMDHKDQWCTQCKWKKACSRFGD